MFSAIGLFSGVPGMSSRRQSRTIAITTCCQAQLKSGECAAVVTVRSLGHSGIGVIGSDPYEGRLMVKFRSETFDRRLRMSSVDLLGLTTGLRIGNL